MIYWFIKYYKTWSGCKRTIIIVVLTFLNSNLRGQFLYKKIPSKYGFQIQENTSSRLDILNMDQAYDLTECLPKNHVKDGSIDYSIFLQSALNKYRKVVFPNFPILIGDDGLNISSNSTLIFLENSNLIMHGSSQQSYAILKLYGVENCSIYYPKITGDRKRHIGKGGQWGMGISIRGAKNINIFGPHIENCWGDAIYIGSINNNYSKNISIYNGLLDYNRRNGISIVSGDSITIRNTLIQNTYGYPPMSGIDIEPNNNNDYINNIIIDSVTTFNNAKRGILVNLNKLVGASSKTVNILIRNHKDYDSNVGLFLAVSKVKHGNPLKGEINIDNPSWSNNAEAIHYYKGPSNDLRVVLKGVSIYRQDALGRAVIDVNAKSEAIDRLSRIKNIKIVN